jgi:hypothetical protein
MIYVADNFLSDQWYSSTRDRLLKADFTEVVVGDKSFHVQVPSEQFVAMVEDKISLLEGSKVTNILSFFRVATDEIDTDWRIHSDLKINGTQPDRAVVLFMSPPDTESGLSGTAFWSHVEYGHRLPEGTKDSEFDRMLLEDANDVEMWRLNSVIGHMENRLISYPASYFHSKYPNIAWEGKRIVYVMFYCNGKKQ